MNDCSSVIVALNDARQAIWVSNTITRSCCTDNPTDKFAFLLVEYEFELKHVYLALTGSAAEFYIEPALSCISDIDIMSFPRKGIVTESDNPEFPDVNEQYEENVSAWKIENIAKYPGFVRLRYVGDFCYSLESEQYQFVGSQFSGPKYAKKALINIRETSVYGQKRVGPAEQFQWNEAWSKRFLERHRYIMPKDIVDIEGRDLPIDIVSSCSSCFWPSVAAEWKLRDRPHSWPSASLIQNVVVGGCDVVCAAYLDCPDEEFVFRLSFSRAEVMLIRSWSHVQQVVYHMLRFIAKRELINAKWEKGNKVLSTYHIKTLMLWSCETRGMDFWTQHVVDICCKLLATLFDSLQQRFFPNYFIRSSNLFYHIQNETNRQEVMDKLKNLQLQRVLSEWFFNNYIEKSEVLTERFLAECRKFVQLFPRNPTISDETASSLLSFNSDNREQYHKVMERGKCLYEVYTRRIYYTLDASSLQAPFLLGKLVSRKKSFTVGHWVPDFITAFQLLNLVKHLRFGIFDSELEREFRMYDYIVILYKQWEVHRFPFTCSKELLKPGRRYFILAQELMTGLDGQNSPHETQLLTKLSIECLQKSMTASDSVTNLSTQKIVLVYLAVLHYKRREYATAIDLCLKVLEDHKRNRQGIRTCRYVNGRLLQFVDDIASIRGLLNLCRYYNIIYKRPEVEERDLGNCSFTPEIVSLHLLNLCRPGNWKVSWRLTEPPTLADQCIITLNKYRIKLSVAMMKGTTNITFGPFPNVKSSDEHSVVKENEHSSTSWNEMNQLLMDVYFEKLTLAFDIFRNYFGFDCAADILLCALFSYRSGQYNVALQLCDVLERKVMKAYEDGEPCVACIVMFDMSVKRPIDMFFDDDFQAVIGLGLLLQTVCARSSVPEDASESVAESLAPSDSATVALFRQIFKDRISMFSLVKYLKIRCLMATKRTKKEMLAVYRMMQSDVKISPLVPHRIFLVFARQLIKKISRS